jgi:hypothetical protein
MRKIQLGGHRGRSTIKGYAIVDDDVFETLGKHKWCLNNNGYAIRRGAKNQGGKLILMHRVVMDKIPKNMEVDHINRDTLDNRRKNLRLATKSNNGINRGLNKNNKSGFKGVFFNKKLGKWNAVLKVDYLRKHLGTFNTAELAGRAYNKAAVKYFGDFAYLNK